MASTVATAAFGLTAKTKPFRRDMKLSSQAVGGLGRSLGFLRAKAIGFGTTLTAVVGVGSLGFLVKKSLEAIDATSKLSDRIGIETQALVGLQHAATITGTSKETLNKGLEKMVRNLGDAKQGFGESVRSLDALGLSAADLANQSPDQAFAAIADKIKGIENPALRASIAYGIFGRKGQELTNMLMLGSEGLKEQQKRAEMLGTTFSRVDGAKIEAANDSIFEMKELFTGLGNTIAVQIAPFITHFSQRLIESTTAGGGMGQIVSKAFGFIAKATGFALEAVDGLRFGWDLFKIGVVGGAAGVLGGFNSIANFVNQIPHYFDVAVAKGAEYFLRGVDVMGRSLVDLINLIPGVEIGFTDAARNMADGLALAIKEKIKPEEIDFTGGLAQGLDLAAREMGAELRAGLANGAFDTSMKFEEWFKGVQDEAQKAAEAVATNAQKASFSGIPEIESAKKDSRKAREAPKGAAALQAGSAAALKAIARSTHQGDSRRDVMQARQNDLLTRIGSAIAQLGDDMIPKLAELIEVSKVVTNVNG